jgi:hypothetical protein
MQGQPYALHGQTAEPPHPDGPRTGTRRGTLLGMSTLTPRAAEARSVGRRMTGPLGTLATVGAAWAVVALLRPGDAGPTPCPWRTLTGLDCPFCGSTRAAATLASGDVIGALDHNALFVLGILPLAAVAWLVWAGRAWRGTPTPIVSNRMVVVLMGLTLAWWALRLAVPWLGSSAS